MADRAHRDPAFLLSAPAPSLPLGYFIPGLAALFSALLLLPFLSTKMVDWYYQQELLAAVHTFTLGFVTAVFLGASAQLLPVVTGVELRRTALVRASNALFAVAVLGMVLGFWRLRWPVTLVSAGAAIAAVGLFLSAAVPLLLRARRDGVFWAFALAFTGLALTMSVGFLLGWNRHSDFLPGAPLAHLAAHLHLGLLATFAVAILGVEMKLLPMFLLAPAPSAPRQKAVLALVFGGSVGLAAALWFGLPAAPFALAPLAGLGLHLSNLAYVLRERRRREIDAGFVYALSAYGDLLLAAGVGLAWSLGLGRGTALPIRLAYVYVFLLLVGFVGQTVVGILSKIVPFLVWQAAYARRVGLARVPTLKEISPEPLQRAGFFLFRVASTAFAVALLRGVEAEMRAASLALVLSLVPFAIHIARSLSHLARPRVTPPLEAPSGAPLAA